MCWAMSPLPVHARWLTGQGGGPEEQGQQQEHGAQHAGLAEVRRTGLVAEATARLHPHPGRWASSPVLGWVATSGARSGGGRLLRSTSELAPKACQGLGLSRWTYGYQIREVPDTGH